MKLANVLSAVNQVEKSKFLNFIDRVCLEAMDSNKELSTSVNNLDGQIKNASNGEVIQLFKLVLPYFETSVRQELALIGSQASLLINILTRDGNCISRISWIETLYTKEWKTIDNRAKELKALISLQSDNQEFDEAKRLMIYHACLKEAFENDRKINREAKVTDDERGILNVVANQLGITADDRVAIDHLVNPIPKTGVQECLGVLREIALILVSRKHHTVYVPDEIIAMLYRIQNKEIADRHLLRILRTLSDPELSNILKSHNKRIRGVERKEKIDSIMHMGLSATQILCHDIHNDTSSVNEKKERLKLLIEELNLTTDKLGSTLEERSSLIINSLNTSSEREFDALTASGYNELFSALQKNLSSFVKQLRIEFEIEDNVEIDAERLKTLSISPQDILYMLSNEDIKIVKESMGITKRGNPRFAILESFAHATDKLIDNYKLLACRDLAGLKSQGVEISESDLGIKFEEVTKTIMEHLGMNIDEDLRRSINTAKDKADIIISLSDDDIIVGEVKSFKNGEYSKYSTTSRQVKAYASRCENAGKRVAQVLIVAPHFSNDFVESAEMDTEVNISLLEADGLKKIYDAFKARKRPKFSAKLFTKGGLLKADLIAKNI